MKKLWQIWQIYSILPSFFANFHNFHNIPYANELQFAKIFSAKLLTVLIHQNFFRQNVLMYGTPLLWWGMWWYIFVITISVFMASSLCICSVHFYMVIMFCTCTALLYTWNMYVPAIVYLRVEDFIFTSKPSMF